MRDVLARQWERTSVMTFAFAALLGVRAGSATPRWDPGDLLVGVYFLSLSLLFWIRAAQLRRGRGYEGSAARTIALVTGLGVGAVLVLMDMLTAGHVI